VEKGVQAGEVIGVGRVKRQPLGDRSSCDHQIGDAAPRLTGGRDDGCRHAPKDAGRLGLEWHRVKLVLDPLQDVQAPGSFGMFARCSWSGGGKSSGHGPRRLSAGCLPVTGRADRGIQDAGCVSGGPTVRDSQREDGDQDRGHHEVHARQGEALGAGQAVTGQRRG
jgi:hypothetical protein